MPAMTYNSLISEIEAYLNRSDADTINQIPSFIYQAEQRIALDCKNIGLEVYVNANFTPGLAVYPKPARWRRTITFNFGNGSGNNVVNQMYLRSYEYCRAFSNNSNTTAAPQYYSDYAYDHWLVVPTPDQAYPFEVGYLELPEPLSTLNQTNWITNNAPSLLLYASLLEAIPYLKNFEMLVPWTEMYTKYLNAIEGQDQKRYTDRTSSRESD